MCRSCSAILGALKNVINENYLKKDLEITILFLIFAI
jgi:hypothetical protein